MKRKYLSALLMGTLAVASTSTFTSCKDYDSDISNLQQQIDKLATKDELSSKVTELQTLVNTNKTDIATLKKDMNDCTTLDEVKDLLADYATKQYVNDADKTLEDAIKALQTGDIAQLKADVLAAQTAAQKATDSIAVAKAEVVETLNSYATKSEVTEVKEAAETAIAAVEKNDTVALNKAKAEILAKLQDYATKNDLQEVANAATATKAQLEIAIATAKNTADAAKAAAATNAAAIAALATTTQNASDALALAQANKTKIDNALAALGEGFSKEKTVAAAIEAIQGQIGNAETKLGTLDTRLSSVETALNAISEGEDNHALAVKISGIEGSLKSIIGEYTTMVTGVELVASYGSYGDFGKSLVNGWYPNYDGIRLNMIHGLVEESSVFGDEVSDKIENPISYEKGQNVKDDNSIIVRVSPANAELTKNTKIVLLNSKGESLEDFVKVGTPERYNELITTRATNINSGLWKLPVSVADGVSEEDFQKATEVNGKSVLYAVAINNTTASKDSAAAADRYVVSTYDVNPSYKGFEADNSFSFKVNETSVENIHNRWEGSRVRTETNQKSTTNPELVWNSNGPATAPITTGDNANVQSAGWDLKEYRFWQQLLQVEVGKKFTISDVAASNTNNAADYYYVVLDKANAIESAPSELNAWNSYKIDGLCKTVKAGESLDLTINSESANGDVIGFRVYAVNRDGKLLDPDGRAFYVVVGNAVSGNIIGKLDAYKGITDKQEIKVVDDVAYKGWTLDTEASKDALPFLSQGLVPSFTPVYYDKNGNKVSSIKDASHIAFEIADPQYIADGATVVFKCEVSRFTGSAGTDYKVGEVTASYTKVLPTSFPSDITFRPKQETTDGSGNFVAYMKPVSDYTVGTSAKTKGTVDLDNIFYNLDNNVSFTVKDAAKEKDKTVDAISDDQHVLTIAKDFIDSKTSHAVTASYNYGEISCQKIDGVWTTKNWTVASDKSMNVTFACWESANKYTWTDKAPSLQWSVDGTEATVAGSAVTTKNSYNNTYFGGKLDVVLGKNYLKIKENSANLYYGSQKDPYFKVTVDANGKFTFTQAGTQVENAPVADHKETLKFTVLDAFYHETVVSLDVTIKRPASAARKH